MTFHTEDLSPTPTRNTFIAASDWLEAPDELLALGHDFGGPEAGYRRRIGRWLLWRSGPPARGHARYLALDADDLSIGYTFRLWPDGHGEGTGPDGVTHTRFRTWKESLRDA